MGKPGFKPVTSDIININLHDATDADVYLIFDMIPNKNCNGVISGKRDANLRGTITTWSFVMLIPLWL